MDKSRILQAIRQGTADPWVACRYLDLKPDAPDPPDYAAAATAQGAANVDAALASSLLANPSFTNPYGSRDVAFDPSRNYTTSSGQVVPGMKVTDTLSPVEQQKLDMNNQLATSLLGTAQTGLNNVNQVFSTPFDSSNLPAITTPMGPAGLKEVSDALLARLQPQLDQRREALRTQNVNTGFAPGSTGYDQGMDEYWRSANDMQLAALAQAQQAASTSYGMEADARTKALQEQLALRQLPLNEINALRTGNQAALPQFQQYQGQSAAPAPIMQGAIAQGNADIAAYNADAAASGNLMGGLFDLGGAALASPWLMSSDRRLKKNIKRVGTHTLGIGIYEFDYVKGGHAVGVMSDEVRSVLPQAVVVDADGFDMVDYSLL